MKKLLFAFVLMICGSQTAMAHNLWIETGGEAQIGEAHNMRIYYGEYTYDYYESVSGNFTNVADFTLWLVKPGGEKVELEAKPEGETFYSASFTPEKKGTYQLMLVSNKTAVVDWTAYDLGVLKPDFYATALVVAGSQSSTANTVKEAPLKISTSTADFVSGEELELQVTFRGEPVAENEVVISVADQWIKTVQTDEEGKVVLGLPWEGQYVIETVHTEEVPGRYQGDSYEAIRHTATFTLKAE